MLKDVPGELKRHAPFTAFGTLTGLGIMGVIVWTGVSKSTSARLFWTLHPLHVLLSALVTTAMYERHGPRSNWSRFLVGYFGSIGIATLSDSVMPFVGEWMMNLPNRGVHIGFIEKWWLVNPLAVVGILVGARWPHTRTPHAAHVLLSTWASLFHMTMAGAIADLGSMLLAGVFLFLAVWVPCCTSDIVFPLLFVRRTNVPAADAARGHAS